MTLEYPIPYFNDITHQIREWKEEIDSKLLSRLVKISNKLLISNVLCPWRCSEYIHVCGYVEIDLIMQRYVQKYYLVLSSNDTEYKKEYSSRDNYIRNDSEYDKWLLNSDWKVTLCITYDKDNVPMILTCRHHKGWYHKD